MKLDQILTEKKHHKKKWSADVETEWSPPEGFFTGSASKIAKGLKAASDDLKQAMSRLNFYINRAGSNLDAESKDRLESAKDKLRSLYESDDSDEELAEDDQQLDEEVSPAEEARRRELYKKWRTLINMSADSLEKFKKAQVELGKKDPKKYPGLKPEAAKSIGISAGVESANWIIKMKRTPVAQWTPEMWRWAGKQVSFVSRMLGNRGPLYDEHGEPTRKLLSLKIWGHNPR